MRQSGFLVHEELLSDGQNGYDDVWRGPGTDFTWQGVWNARAAGGRCQIINVFANHTLRHHLRRRQASKAPGGRGKHRQDSNNGGVMRRVFDIENCWAWGACMANPR